MMYKTVLVVAMFLQWHGFPTPGIPRTSDGKPNLSAPLPRAADGKPDLSGIWMATRPRFNVAQSLKAGDSVPFQPWAKAVFDERQANNSKDDPSARCLPTGLTLRATLATPLKIVQIPGLTLILYDISANIHRRPSAAEGCGLAGVARILYW